VAPDSALGIAAQIAVALAGFAGVVTAFRAQSIHEWEALDRLRLRLLLINSILPLALALFGLTLLSVQPPPNEIWRWCSGTALAVTLPGMWNVGQMMRSFAPAELAARQVHRAGFRFFGTLGTLSILAQIYNVAVLNAFWPFFTGIAVTLLAAMFQFMLMILRPAAEKM
jgi:hypothetical protein